METAKRLEPLLDRWLAEADAGRLLSAAELCGECPELLPEVEQEIAVLQRFHVLARPDTSINVQRETTPEAAAQDSAPDVPQESLLRPGNTFGRYEILAELGKGGMGIVYKARDTQLGRELALKVMRQHLAANSISSHRFLREARALAAVRHDHVVEIYDYGEMQGVRFVTMPLLAGETLKARLDKQGALPPAEVLRIGIELTEGLDAVHKKGLIHRDLKPSNVWLEAPHGRVKLLDFGLARDSEAGDQLTSCRVAVGTPAYMSPEQVNGLNLDARSDLFSLGSVLYEAATGQPAFAASTRTAMLKAVGEIDPPPARTMNQAVPRGLSDVIEGLHRKNLADRPTTAAEVSKTLHALVTAPETPTTDWDGPHTASKVRRRKSHRIRLTLATALGLCLAAGFVFALLRMNRGPVASLRVQELEILHFASLDDKNVILRGALGKDSFGATLNDDIKVVARLSRPAYCYLIVFRPDEKDEVLYPQSANDAPELTDEPRYPSKDRSKVYGLTDGAGLWLVALVASDVRLPPYAAWRRYHSVGPWAKVEGEPGVVWFDHGQWLEAVTPGGVRYRGARGEKQVAGSGPLVQSVPASGRGARGEKQVAGSGPLVQGVPISLRGARGEKQVAGSGPLVQQVVNCLKAETGGEVSAVAFTVEKKE
jgi:serine/threonine protein kinase